MDKLQVVKEIKSRLLLSSVIKTAVGLKERGDSFIGLCPFHEEKTPSFHVRDKAFRFKCFGCGASGDVIEFVMRLRGISFNDALDELALKAGIKLENSFKKAPAPLVDDLLTAQKIAQEYFLTQLRKFEHAREYLYKNRGLSAKMVDQAGLGYGGSSLKEFMDHLQRKGVSSKLALAAGLIRSLNEARFSHRITFPIRDFEGNIIAFGARSLLEDAPDTPKYVNTHSYAHYEKRKNFYGLFESKNAILKGKTPILVEGYFDAMAMWALGQPALALCGTALSSEHVEGLKRLTSRVTICFDKDTAGYQALKKALVTLYKKDVLPTDLIVMDEKDPGDYLSKNALSALRELVAKPVDALCYVIDNVAFMATTTISERIRQIDELMPIFLAIKRSLIRRQYVAYFAKNLHEDAALLWAEIERKIQSKTKVSAKPQTKIAASKSLSSFERLLVEIILINPSFFEDITEEINACSSEAKNLISALFHALNHQPLGHKGLKDLKKSLNEHWPILETVLLNRLILEKDAAEKSLKALKAKFQAKKTKEALKIKRQELYVLEKKGDFSLILKNLGEQSAMVMSGKKKTSFLAPASPQKEQNAPVLKKAQNISVLEDSAFFDGSEDWL